MLSRFLFLLFLSVNISFSMGIQSFVALPIDKGGSVLRVQNLYNNNTNTETLITNIAYGINSKQTLLVGTSYQINPDKKGKDISMLYRYIIHQKDRFEGTSRFAILGGGVLPTTSDSDSALQGGFVYTYFRGKNEIDFDMLYQEGLQDRENSGKYDLSWQYRVFPSLRDEWGISQELNTVVELNGKWVKGNKTTHQNTLGLQWIHPRWVLEAAYIKELNNNKYESYLLSLRVHF